MKKKLTAILLTLCMVLGMLPMSVLAAWYHNDAEVTLSGKTVEVDGNTYYILADNIPANPGEGDSIDYYEYYQGGYTWAGKLTWKADKAEEYTITVQKPENGTASASAVKAAAGAKVTVTATPSAGYELDKITVTGADGSVVKVANDNSFIMPAGNVTVTVTFKKTVVTPTEYTITAKAVPADGGTVTTTPAAKAVKGTEVTVTATPNKGWKIDSIKSDDVKLDVDINDAYKFTMPATDVTVVANFSRITVQVPVTPDESGNATVSDTALDEALSNAADTRASQITIGGETTEADTVKLTADQAKKLAAAEGVKAVEVATTAGSVVLPTDGIGDSAVEVSLATNTAEDGTKTMSLSVKGLKPNTKITVKPAGMNLTPGKSYTYVDSNGNLQTVTVDEKGYIELLTNANGEISLDNIQFVEAQTYTITVDTAEHGTVTTDPADKAPAGVKVTVNAKADTGYKLSKITVTDASGAKVTVASDNTFTMPASNVTVSATFTKSGSTGGGGGGGGGGATSYSVKVASTEHGKVTVRPDSAVKDQKVTITVTPDKGYALDTLTVTDANGNKVTLTKVNDTTYTFLMPGVGVTVEADFAATGEEPAETPKFSDVADKNYTFYADIMWAAEKGYMNGYSNGTFRPNNSTTRQALWMVLARIDGANPSDMSAARAWAMASKISDGTNPEAAMSRQQMVTMLYRYAQLKGYKTTGGTSISAYPDAAGVASYAQDAMSWAVGNGIVTGTSDGRLNPAGTASRAHFAAFLHRFCTTAGIA